ncbi:hypothetical protein OG693_39390 (plasmid) [Streptomyces sp. NBC_01259]|uniref:hypothetical protein n=1 Tax=Streptomyces sp. NBC_01259 TaxID=2903800 RepID=UPI002F90F7D8
MTERIPLGDLTSDQLDQLYERLDLLQRGAVERSALLEEARDALETAGINEAHGGESWPRLVPAIEQLAHRAEQAQAAIEQAELDAEQQARHFHTVCGERESYRQAWKYEQKRRAVAEAAIERVRQVAAEWGEPHHCGWLSASVLVRQLRDALDQAQQPTTTETLVQRDASTYWQCAHCGNPITGNDWTWANLPHDPAESIWDKKRYHVDQAECQAAASAIDQPQQPTTTKAIK